MKLRKATKKDLLFLFNLRNEPESVKYSKRGKLRLDEVENDYFHNPNKRAYIAEKDEKPIGYVIYEYLEKNVLELSEAISLEQRGKGLGKLLLKESTIFAIKELKAEKIIGKVFSKNIAAIKNAQACSYKLVNNKSEPWEFVFNKSLENNLFFIFDFDGVIGDSINSLYETYINFLKEYRVNGNQEEFNLLNGPKLSEIVSFLKNKHRIQKDEKELLELYQNKIESIYKKIKLNDDIENILEWLKKKNIKIALASSSKKESILSILKRYNIEKYFDFIITGNDIKKAKPSPEIYNIIKKKFPNYNFYVIEDSKNGLQAAKDARMKTIFYNPKNKSINLESTHTIYTISQIKNIITEIELNCFMIAKTDKIALKIIKHVPRINSFQRKAIEKLWDKELKKRNLFNGNILSYMSHKTNQGTLNIKCFITQYKYFFAQLKNPQLNLNIAPIGVSGIILDEKNNTLFAIRQNVTEYNGYYELMPTGSINPSKKYCNKTLFQSQLINEFEEETKISKANIKKVEPFCLIFDKNHKVYDLCSKIYVKGNLKLILNNKKNKEYRNIKLKNLDDIKNSLQKNIFTPTSNVILNNI